MSKRKAHRSTRDADAAAGAPRPAPHASAPARPAFRRADVLGVVVIAIASLVALGPVLGNGFLSWDDYSTVARNPHFNPPTWGTVAHYWAEPHMHLWVPLTYTVWAGLAALSYTFKSGDAIGLSPAWFHGANLLLHVLAALVVWRLLRRLVRHDAGALLGALLFAVHPIQVEAIAWASGLKDVLAALLMWTAVWLYVGAADRAGERRWWGAAPGAYVLATLAFVAAMLAKPSAVVAPALAGVFEAIILRRPVRRFAAAVLVWVLLAIPCVLWTRHVQPPLDPVPQPPPHLRPLVATDALAFYAYKVAVPLGLAIDQGRRPDAVLASGAAYWNWMVPLLVAAGLLYASVRLRRRLPEGGWIAGPMPSADAPAGRTFLPGLAPAAGLVSLVCLAPVLGLVPFDFQQYSTVAEHYAYPAMVGPALLLALLVARLSSARPAAADNGIAPPGAVVAVSALLVVLAVISHVQARRWENNVTLFSQAVAVNPRSAGANFGLASALVEAGDFPAAAEYAKKAIELDPTNPQAYLTLGLSLSQRRGATQTDLAAAVAAYRKAVDLAPGGATAHAQLGALLAQTGHPDEGRQHLETAVRLDPADAMARQNLGALFAQIGKPDDAIREMHQAVRLAPHAFAARANLGWLLLEKGDAREARDHFEAALRVNPNFDPARRGLEECRRRGAK